MKTKYPTYFVKIISLFQFLFPRERRHRKPTLSVPRSRKWRAKLFLRISSALNYSPSSISRTLPQWPCHCSTSCPISCPGSRSLVCKRIDNYRGGSQAREWRCTANRRQNDQLYLISATCSSLSLLWMAIIHWNCFAIADLIQGSRGWTRSSIPLDYKFIHISLSLCHFWKLKFIPFSLSLRARVFSNLK